MAGESFSTIQTVLSQIYSARLADARNMAAFELSAISVVPNDSGKNIAWVAKFDGTRNITNYADDGTAIDAAEYTKTAKVPATLGFGLYRSPVMVTDLAATLAGSSGTGSPTELINLVDHEIKDALMQITKQVAIDFYVGDGTAANTNPNIVGLTGGAALSTGTYAGIDRATYTQWAANEIANGGVDRPLTDDLLRQAEVAIFNAGGEPPNLILTTANVHRKYANLFGSIQRVQTAGAMPQQLGMGTNELLWGNMPVQRSARAPAKKLFMLNTNDVEFVFPERMMPYASVPLNPMVKRLGLDLKQQYMLPIIVNPLGTDGNALKFNVWTNIQLRVRNPNRVATIADISEA